MATRPARAWFPVLAVVVAGCIGPERPRPAELEYKEAAVPVKLFRVILPVASRQKAAEFYSAVLGTPGVKVSDGRHYFDCGGTILACFSPREDGDSFDARPNPDHLYFAVDDLEATYDRCIQAGATPAKGDVHGAPAGKIAQRPWGERSFYIKDPFGNPICFVARTTVFTGGRP